MREVDYELTSSWPPARVERGPAARPVASFLWLRRLYHLHRLCSMLRILGVKKGLTPSNQMLFILTGQMSSVETGQMSAVETGRMSAAETRHLSCLTMQKTSLPGWSRRLKSAACRSNCDFWNSSRNTTGGDRRRPAQTGADRGSPRIWCQAPPNGLSPSTRKGQDDGS